MRNPLHTKLCDRLGIEYPVVAFTHCKDVAVAVINAGGFAVLGEAMHPPEHIAADIRWIRERVNGKPFGIDLVLPASVPEEKSLEELYAMIPAAQREYTDMIKKKYSVPDPKEKLEISTWGGLDHKRALDQLEVLWRARMDRFGDVLAEDPTDPEPGAPT